MLIKVKFPYSWCENCPKVDPVLIKDSLYSDDKEIQQKIVANCYHDDFCEAVFEHMKEYTKNV